MRLNKTTKYKLVTHGTDNFQCTGLINVKFVRFRTAAMFVIVNA